MNPPAARTHVRRLQHGCSAGRSSTPSGAASWDNTRALCYVFTLINVCLLVAIVYVRNSGGGSMMPHNEHPSVVPEGAVAENSTISLMHRASGVVVQASTDSSSPEKSGPALDEASAKGAALSDNRSAVFDTDTLALPNATDDSRVNESMPAGAVARSGTLEPMTSTTSSANNHVASPSTVIASNVTDRQSSSGFSILTAEQNISDLPCPTLFVYPNVPVFDGGVKPRDITLQAFGQKQSYPGLYKLVQHGQFNLAELVMYRLYHSEHCRVTTNASDADLFIIPVLTAPKGSTEWEQACADSKLWRKSTIRSNAGNTLSFLPHLNNQTANKHVFIVAKGHYYGRGGPCDWIPGNPPFSPVFRNIQRFAYSHTYEGHKYGDRKWAGAGPLRLDGRVISVPYPSSFHWSVAEFGGGRSPPWQQFDDRPTRVFMVAGMHGKQRELRQRLAKDCNVAGKPLCIALTRFSEDAMEDKQSAVFCLEPEGDSPFRKSVYDSIVSGCIPVLFSPDSDAVSPWHWGLFRESSRVLLSESEYMAARPGVDGLRILYDMPLERIAELQASIARYAHRLQISIDDYPTGDDSFEIMLKKAHLRSQGHTLEELAKSW